MLAAMMAFVIAGIVVFFSYPSYFAQNMVVPVDKVYAATIQAGIAPGVAWSLALWAIPGAILQLIGGPKRQLGVLFATGMLINSPMAGWAVMLLAAVRPELFGPIIVGADVSKSGDRNTSARTARPLTLLSVR